MPCLPAGTRIGTWECPELVSRLRQSGCRDLPSTGTVRHLERFGTVRVAGLGRIRDQPEYRDSQRHSYSPQRYGTRAGTRCWAPAETRTRTRTRTGTRTGTRSQTRSGLEGQLQGGNRPEEEGPTLRKISARQGAGKAEEEGLCFAFSFAFFFSLYFFSMHT